MRWVYANEQKRPSMFKFTQLIQLQFGSTTRCSGILPAWPSCRHRGQVGEMWVEHDSNSPVVMLEGHTADVPELEDKPLVARDTEESLWSTVNEANELLHNVFHRVKEEELCDTVSGK